VRERERNERKKSESDIKCSKSLDSNWQKKTKFFTSFSPTFSKLFRSFPTKNPEKEKEKTF
jgi:hypothetical protein